MPGINISPKTIEYFRKHGKNACDVTTVEPNHKGIARVLHEFVELYKAAPDADERDQILNMIETFVFKLDHEKAR